MDIATKELVETSQSFKIYVAVATNSPRPAYLIRYRKCSVRSSVTFYLNNIFGEGEFERRFERDKAF